MSSRTMLVLLGLIASATSLPAQSEALGTALGVGYVVLGVGAIHRLTSGSDDVRVGSVVRATARTPRGLVALSGSVIAIDADSLTLDVDSTLQRIARWDLRSFDVYRGTEHKWAQGWAAGFIAGGALGAVAGYASGDDKGNDFLQFTATQKAGFLGAFGALSGSLIGSLIGAAVAGDRWDHLDRLPLAPSVSVVPLAHRGVAVSAHVRF
ncbi:MAG: hypothetical protein JWM41_3608 [Gemmatimonadetes bacterium]|nr:hypothetical protein [Gemmatimonadota bacterium]